MVERFKRLGLPIRRWLYSLPAPPVFRGIFDLIIAIIKRIGRDDGSHMAAGLSYYAIFSLFPLALATISVAGFFVNEDEVRVAVLDFLEQQLGMGSEQLVTDNVNSMLRARGTIGLVAIVTLFWSSRAVFGALHRVLNRAWQVTEPSHFITVQIAQIIAALGIAFLLVFTATVGPAGRAMAARNDSLFGLGVPWGVLFTVLPLIVSTALFLAIYKYVPDCKVRWRDAIPAALLASALYEIAKTVFAFFLSNLTSLDLVYGSVTTIIALMLFLYIVSLIIVLGAELSSEYHRASTSGLLVFRDHWRPVPSGLAPIAKRPIPHREPSDVTPAAAANGNGALVYPEGLDLLPDKEKKHTPQPVRPQGIDLPSSGVREASGVKPNGGSQGDGHSR